MNKITNFLIEYYGLVIDFHNNQLSGNRKEMLKFFSFESNSNINKDFLKFIQKDKEWLCGINSEYFKIPKEAMSDYFDDEHDKKKRSLNLQNSILMDISRLIQKLIKWHSCQGE